MEIRRWRPGPRSRSKTISTAARPRRRSGSASIDHVISRVYGGPHRRWKFQLLHQECNSAKGKKITAEALELAGAHGVTISMDIGQYRCEVRRRAAKYAVRATSQLGGAPSHRLRRVALPLGDITARRGDASRPPARQHAAATHFTGARPRSRGCTGMSVAAMRTGSCRHCQAARCPVTAPRWRHFSAGLRRAGRPRSPMSGWGLAGVFGSSGMTRRRILEAGRAG
jgi:hypothetical protein